MGRPHADRCSVNPCLYDWLGGAVAVDAVVDDAVDRHATNPALAPLICGKDLPQIKALGVRVFSAKARRAVQHRGSRPGAIRCLHSLQPGRAASLVVDMTEALREQGLGSVEVAEIVPLPYAVCEAASPWWAAIRPGTIQERGLHSLQPSRSNGGSAYPKEKVDMNQATTTLYERLGCREGITRITADLMKNHLANPLVNARYINSEDLERVERRAVEFFCAGTGGPEKYTGKDMLATHKGMNINEQEFMAVLDDAMDALQKNGIDEATRNEVLAVLWSMRREVVRV